MPCVFSAYHEISQPTEAINLIRALIHSYDPDTPEECIQQAVTERQSRFDKVIIYFSVNKKRG